MDVKCFKNAPDVPCQNVIQVFIQISLHSLMKSFFLLTNFYFSPWLLVRKGLPSNKSALILRRELTFVEPFHAVYSVRFYEEKTQTWKSKILNWIYILLFNLHKGAPTKAIWPYLKFDFHNLIIKEISAMPLPFAGELNLY